MAAENEESMHKPTTLSRLGGLLGAALSAVGDKAKLPESATFGPNPTLPTPRKERIPTVHIARAKGWPEGVTPKAAPGFLDVRRHTRRIRLGRPYIEQSSVL